MLLIHMNTLHIYRDNNLPSLLAGLKTQPFSPSLLGYDKHTFLRCCHQGSLSPITWCCALPFILHSPKGMNQWLLFEYITLCVPSSAFCLQTSQSVCDPSRSTSALPLIRWSSLSLNWQRDWETSVSMQNISLFYLGAKCLEYVSSALISSMYVWYANHFCQLGSYV